MNMPGFTAHVALKRGHQFRTNAYMSSGSTGFANRIIPQACDTFKGAGCFFGPISWCFPASFGGTDSFCDCVDKLSGGNCIDCTNCGGVSGRGLDPRDQSGTAPTGKVASGQFGITENPPPGPDWGSLKQQLNRIERCTCGTPKYGGGVVAVPPVFVSPPVFTPPVPPLG